MSAEPAKSQRRMIRLPAKVPVVQLACTGCQCVYELDVADFGTGHTGCPRCGGWTWMAQLAAAEWSAVTSANHLDVEQQASDSTSPDPAVLPPRNPTGPGSPTTSQ